MSLSKTLVGLINSDMSFTNMLDTYLRALSTPVADKARKPQFSYAGATYIIQDVDISEEGLVKITGHDLPLPFGGRPVEEAPYVEARVKVTVQRASGEPPSEEELDTRDQWRSLLLCNPDGSYQGDSSCDLVMGYDDFTTIWFDLIGLRNLLVVEADLETYRRIEEGHSLRRGMVVVPRNLDENDPEDTRPPAVIVQVLKPERADQPDLILMQCGELFSDFSWRCQPFARESN